MRRLLGVGVIPLLLAVAACGSDEPETLSKSEYIEQADVLCTAFMNEVDAQELPTSPDEAVEYFDALIPSADETHAGFEELEPPPDGTEVHEALLTSLSESTDKVREAREAAARGDGEAINAAMAEAAEIGQRADEQAKAYGFEICGSEGELRAP